MIRRYLKQFLLTLLAGLFLLSCFFISPEKASDSILHGILAFPFLRYFPLENFSFLATVLILTSFLLHTPILFYFTYPLLRFCKTRRGLSLSLIAVSFLLALFFGTSVSLYFTLPLCMGTLGKEEESPFLFIHCFCLQILAAEMGSILFPFTSLSEFYLFLQYNYSFLEYFRISFLFFLFAILFLLPYALCFQKEENHALSFAVQERLEISYSALQGKDFKKTWRSTLPFLIFVFLLFLSILRVFPIFLCFLLLLLYSLLFNRDIFRKVDYFLLVFIVLLFFIRGNLFTMHKIPNLLSRFIQGRETSRALILSTFFTRLPTTVLLADISTKGRQLIISSILSALHPLALNYSGVIAYTMMKNRPHWKVFLLHYLFLHIQMLLLFVFLAFFTGNL